MTVESPNNTVSYVGTGTDGERFDTTFLFYDEDDLIVQEDGVTQTKDVDYTVEGVGVSSGGTVVWIGATTVGLTYDITRFVADVQSSDYIETGKVPLETLERDLDLAAMRDQQKMGQDVTGQTWDALGRRVVNSADPIANKDLATKDFVQAQVSGSGNVPVPLDPADVGKGLRAQSGGLFNWDAFREVPQSFLADIGKVLTVIGPDDNQFRPPQSQIFNGLINGSMEISQRMGSAVYDAAAFFPNDNQKFTLDRWMIQSDGDDRVDVSRINIGGTTFNGLKALRMVATGTEQFGVAQVIENVNTKKLLNGSGSTVLSLSVWVRTISGAAVSSVRARLVTWNSPGVADGINPDMVSAWNGSGSNPTMNANWIPGLPGHRSVIPVADDWVQLEVPVTISNVDDVGNLAVLVWSDDSAQVAGKIIDITQAQIVVGDTVPPFPVRSHNEELALSQRYFQKSYDADTACQSLVDPGQMMVTYAGSSGWMVPIRYAVALRPNAPGRSHVFRIENPNNVAQGTWRNTGIAGGGPNSNETVTVFNAAGESGCAAEIQATAGAGDRMAGHWWVEAEM